MNPDTTFDSTKRGLLKVLESVKDGRTCLPDFQRSWIWDDDRIRSLLASVSLSYPIGVVMLLETGNPDVQFSPRLIEGAEPATSGDPELLILDGQQRLTALVQALVSSKVVKTWDTRGKPITRWYFIDIERALNDDREEAIVGLPEDRKVRNFRGEVVHDYSTRESEFAAGLFPLSEVFDCSDWRSEHNRYWDYDREKNKLFDAFEKEVVKRFEQYDLPLILLSKETPKEAVCQVFEKVNTGGVSLTVFDLLTATYAASNYNLRTDWETRERHLKQHPVLKGIQSSDFLQAICLLSTRAKRRSASGAGSSAEGGMVVSCKRKDILALSLEEYRAWAEPATQGFEKAARFLFGQKIFAARDVPYRTQITPLAAILAVLGARAENDGVRSKLARWYWCGVFGELYGGSIETRFANDLPQFLAWVDGGVDPDTIREANFSHDRLTTLRSRNSAAYKGLYALLIRDGAWDFHTAEPIDVQIYFDERIDIHHIFPQDWCRRNGIDPGRCDSIVNKTALSARTNRMVGGNAPSLYLRRIQKSAAMSEERLNDILASHLIDSSSCLTDSFDAFFRSREQALVECIERATGKTIMHDAVEEGIPESIEYQTEEDEAYA